MSAPKDQHDFTSQIVLHLPYLRRYARALTGTQTSGDAFAAATLEAILQDRTLFRSDLPARVALFRAFHVIWDSSGAPQNTPDTGLERIAQTHLSMLPPDTRQALLLNSIEQFSTADISQIMQIDPDEAAELVKIGRHELEEVVAGKVLVIEDEAIIAMDIHSIVTAMGHKVTGIGRTRDGAVNLGLRDAPDLILADIQLADNSSGIDAVNDLLTQFGDLPVIFITAFPERLLTGERPEPAFVIPKPYSEDQVRSAVSQAMFFSSTQTLKPT